jgi:S1-C subfamily serine protease
MVAIYYYITKLMNLLIAIFQCDVLRWSDLRLGVLLISCLLYISYYLQPTSATIQINSAQQDSLLPLLYNRTQSSVVSITTKIDPRYLGGSVAVRTTNNSSGQSVDIPLSQGSGFVYDKLGHIVTNYHVLQGGTSVDVRFLDGNSYSARLIGKDAYSDLAVLQLDPAALYIQQLVALPLGNSSSLRVGQHVVAIGNPYGYAGTMTEGIVSQLNLVIPDIKRGSYQSDMIQIDVPITHGNSGGPLLNLRGEVVGVTSGGSGEAGANFINFAIPSDTVARVVPQLISAGVYKNIWLGISGTDVTPDIANTLGLNQAKGVIVTYVTPRSPADTAGINAGDIRNRMIFYTIHSPIVVNKDADIIIGVDNKQVRQQADLLNYVNGKSITDQITLTIIRDRVVHNVNLTLAERPS